MSSFDIAKINSLRHNINKTSREMNRARKMPHSYTLDCTVVQVYPDTMTIDAFCKDTGGTLRGLYLIGNNFSSSSSILTIPEIGQRCIVNMSNQSLPTVIGFYPKNSTGNSEKILDKEFYLGSDFEFIKSNYEDGLISKTLKHSTVNNSLGESKRVSSYKESVANTERIVTEKGIEETVYLKECKTLCKSKEEILKANNIDKGVLNDITTKRNELMNLFETIISETEDNYNNIKIGNEETIKSLDELNSRLEELVPSKSSDYIKTTIGDEYSVDVVVDGVKKAFISVDKNGIINVSCKDILVQKEV